MNNTVQPLIHFTIDVGSVSIEICTLEVLTDHMLSVIFPT
jgi:hypothetical protein